MKPYKLKNKYKTRVKKKKKCDKKLNQKRRKDNKMLSKKMKNGQEKKLDKNNKRMKPKIKILSYELLVSTLSYLMLAL
jgi:hypothetical protein